jgi:hypothetical protein
MEKLALTRNAKRAFDYYERMIAELTSQGYEFAFVGEAYEYVQSLVGLQEYALADWK